MILQFVVSDTTAWHCMSDLYSMCLSHKSLYFNVVMFGIYKIKCKLEARTGLRGLFMAVKLSLIII